MNYRVKTLVMCAMLGVVPAIAQAQRGGAGKRNQVADPAQGRPLPADQRLGQAIKAQLQLTDAQSARLGEVNRRFNQRRVALNQEERDSRMTMRDALCGGDSTRSGEIAKSLDQVIDIEKRRVQMLEDEQKELSGFLTPSQRARYMGIVEQVGAAMGGRGGGGRAGRQGQGGPPDGAPPDGPPNGGPPPGARGGRGRGGDMCANPVPPPGAAGRRGKGGAPPPTDW